jgi:hypothetical protein
MLAKLPGPDVLHSSAEVVAYVGLNPRPVIDGVLGIDVSKNTLDASMSSYFPAQQ